MLFLVVLVIFNLLSILLLIRFLFILLLESYFIYLYCKLFDICIKTINAKL